MKKKKKKKTPCEERKLVQSVSSKERIKRYLEILRENFNEEDLVLPEERFCRRGFEALFCRRYTWNN